MREIQLYDIKNNPEKVNNILLEELIELNNEIYILAAGNHFEFSDDVKWMLKKLIKDIQYYVEV